MYALHKGPRTSLMDFGSRLNLLVFWEIIVPGVLIKSVNGRDLLKLTIFEIYLEKEKTVFLNYFRKYLFYKKICQIKNEARNKLYKKGHMHILPNSNTLVVIIEKLF